MPEQARRTGVGEAGLLISDNHISIECKMQYIGLTLNRKPTFLNSNTLFLPHAISRFSRSRASVSRISNLERAY